MLTSTAGFVKNSSLGCQVTSVPFTGLPNPAPGAIFTPQLLSLNTPSSNQIVSLLLSLQVWTLSQWERKVVILLGYSYISISPDYILPAMLL